MLETEKLKLAPGWYWCKHKFWTNHKNTWLMMERLPDDRYHARDCIVYTSRILRGKQVSSAPQDCRQSDLTDFVRIIPPCIDATQSAMACAALTNPTGESHE